MADDVKPTAAPAAPAGDKPAAAAPAAAPTAPKTSDPFATIKAPEKPKVDDKAAPANGEKPKEGDKPDKNVAIRKNPVEEQRKRIDQQNRELAEARQERNELKAKFEAAQQRGGGDVEAFVAKNKEFEAEISRLRGEIASRDYSKHPDYIEKYQKPFESAADYAKRIVESIEVLGEDGVPRLANFQKDFATIYNLDRPAAAARAKELFGDDRQAVMAQYDELKRLDSNRQNALKEWQTGADEREKKTRAEQIAATQNAISAFKSASKDMMEANPDLFMDKPDSPEEIDIRKQSAQLVDAAYFGRDKLNPEELLVLDAAIHLRATNFPVLQHRNHQLEARVKELEARITGEEGSIAGDVLKNSGDGDKKKANEGSWEKDLEKSLNAG